MDIANHWSDIYKLARATVCVAVVTALSEAVKQLVSIRTFVILSRTVAVNGFNLSVICVCLL